MADENRTQERTRGKRGIAFSEKNLIAACRRELGEHTSLEAFEQDLPTVREQLERELTPDPVARDAALALRRAADAVAALIEKKPVSGPWGRRLHRLQIRLAVKYIRRNIALPRRAPDSFSNGVRRRLVARRDKLPIMLGAPVAHDKETRVLALIAIVLGVRTTGVHRTVYAAINAEMKAIREVARRLETTTRKQSASVSQHVT